jgi:hypothetical protein
MVCIEAKTATSTGLGWTTSSRLRGPGTAEVSRLLGPP